MLLVSNQQQQLWTWQRQYRQDLSASTYYSRNGDIITPAAFFALKAAAMRAQIGNYAARRYYQLHSSNSSLHLYRIACQLHAIEQAMFLQLRD